MAMMLSTMAHTNSSADASNVTKTAVDEGKPAVFHDFLGRAPSSDLSPAGVKTAAASGDIRPHWDASPSASVSVGASSGGTRGPVSTTSDLVSERQVGNHLEGVPFYGPRSDISVHDMGNRLAVAGSKRNSSDSVFIGSSREGFPHVRPDTLENSHLTKMLRNAGGERPKWPRDEETYPSVHALRPATVSYMTQPPNTGKADTNVLKWERTIPMNVGPISQHQLRPSQVVPFAYQSLSNRFKDTNAMPSVISQSAADEGSRTGIKGSGILSSLNANGGVSERTPAIIGKQSSGIHISDLEPSTTTSGGRHGLASASRQMTIFYGGQAHVFDDVHPNKADVIMALAGSNGGSWSTTYSPKSSARQTSGENIILSGENDDGMANNAALLRESRGRFSCMGQTGHDMGSVERLPVRPGIHQSGIVMKNEKAPVPTADHDKKGKHESQEAEHSHR